MSSEQNKAIVRRGYEEAWNKGNLAVIDEILASDSVGYDPVNPEPIRGPEGLKQTISMYRDAFPDLSFTIVDQVAEGDKVATRWTSRGTHKGDLFGTAATGKQTTVRGMEISRLAGGKVVETHVSWDTLGLLQQLGTVPQLAPAQA